MGEFEAVAWRCPICRRDVRLVRQFCPDELCYRPAFFSCGQGEVNHLGVWKPSRGDPLEGTGFACQAKWSIVDGRPGELMERGRAGPNECFDIDGRVEIEFASPSGPT
jgi:hypothetical protein